MCDIACGKQHVGLEEFAASVNAVSMKQWPELGLYDPSRVSGWGEAFSEVMRNTLSAGGTVHFYLTDIDIADALRGDPNEYVGRYTEYELQQIVLNPVWFRITRFYLDGDALSADELKECGIIAPENRTNDSG